MPWRVSLAANGSVMTTDSIVAHRSDSSQLAITPTNAETRRLGYIAQLSGLGTVALSRVGNLNRHFGAMRQQCILAQAVAEIAKRLAVMPRLFEITQH